MVVWLCVCVCVCVCCDVSVDVSLSVQSGVSFVLPVGASVHSSYVSWVRNMIIRKI